MNRKQEFESLLSRIADAPILFAGKTPPRSGAGSPPPRVKVNISDLALNIDEEAVLAELRRAKQRLKKDPSLFSGDPEGFFTYEDPVLAITAYLYQNHLLMSDALGIAGPGGERLRNESYWDWAKTAIHAWLSRNDKSCLTLMGMVPHEPYKLDQEVMRIAVVGDAGFRGQAQSNVIYDILETHRRTPFDLLIHLGDVYFSGNDGEFMHHFLGPFMKVGPTVLTLLGNHDLYFGCDGFLSVLDILRHQPGRYFCVENPHWRIACLDTALPAEHLLRNSGQIDKGQLAWLDRQLDVADGKKTVLMSHHFTVSGWEKPSQELKQLLASRLKKVFAWYWGHEHSCATYSKKAVGCYGACIGNGAFLAVRKPPRRRPEPTWYAKKGNCRCYRDQSDFWPHGYLELELQPTKVVETYHLEGGESHRRTLN